MWKRSGAFPLKPATVLRGAVVPSPQEPSTWLIPMESMNVALSPAGPSLIARDRAADQAQLRRTVSSERFSAVAAMTRQMRTGITGGGIAGKTIEGAGLRGLPDVFLVAIERQGVPTLHAVPPTEVLMAGDVLWFAGGTDAVISLRKVPGACSSCLLVTCCSTLTPSAGFWK